MPTTTPTATEERQRKLDEYVKRNAVDFLLNVVREAADHSESALARFLDEDLTNELSADLFSELWPPDDRDLTELPEFQMASARALSLGTALMLHAADSAEYLRYRAREYALMAEEDIAKAQAGDES